MKIGVTRKNTAVLVFYMIGLVVLWLCASRIRAVVQDGSVAHHKQSHLAHSTLKLSYITVAECRNKSRENHHS